MICNNIFYIKGTQAYALTVNANGGLDGVSEEVTSLSHAQNGDLIIIGRFTWAGGNDHAYHFTCYEFNDGWLHAQGRNEDINAPLDTIRGSSTVVWDSGRLKIYDPFMTTVNGPTFSGGSNVPITVNNITHTVWWNGQNSSFANGYWQTQ